MRGGRGGEDGSVGGQLIEHHGDPPYRACVVVTVSVYAYAYVHVCVCVCRSVFCFVVVSVHAKAISHSTNGSAILTPTKQTFHTSNAFRTRLARVLDGWQRAGSASQRGTPGVAKPP